MKKPLLESLGIIMILCGQAFALGASPPIEIVTSIHGHIYFDANNNSIEDGTDAGIPLIDVIITQSDGTTLTAVTDGNGDWTAVVIPGMTTVDVDESDPDFPVELQQSEGTDPETFNVILDTDVDAGVDGYAGIPDLSLSLFIENTIIEGTTNSNLFISLYETTGNITNGTITVIFPRDNNFTFNYDNSLSTLSSTAINNADWTYDGSNTSFHIWVSDIPITGMGASIIGLEGIFSVVSNSVITYSATVIAGSGGEGGNFMNNLDTETVIRFN